MEILKDYDVTILYHPGKVNVVADTLSKKSERMGSFSCLEVSRHPLDREVQTLANGFIRLELSNFGGFLIHVESRSLFLDQIKPRQFEDAK